MPKKIHLEEAPIIIADDGTQYRINPSAIGASQLNVELPELEVKGKKKSAYKSSFDPTAAWELTGHYPLQYLGKGLDAITPDIVKSVIPYLSPSQWAGTLRGQGLPGSSTNNGFGDSKMDQYLNELFDVGLYGKALAKTPVNMINTVGALKSGGISLRNIGRYTNNRGTWYAPIEYAIANSNIGKRGIEVGMRSINKDYTAKGIKKSLIETLYRGESPYTDAPYKNVIKDYLKQSILRNNPQLNNINKYILTGKIDSAPYLGSRHYQGLWKGVNAPEIPYQNDPVSAYIWGNTLDRRLFTESPIDDLNPLQNYIKENYGNRNIRHYTSHGPYTARGIDILEDYRSNTKRPGTPPMKGQPLIVGGKESAFPVKPGALDKSYIDYDAAGHRYQIAMTPDGLEPVSIRGSDIWKFNPQDYAKKWLVNRVNKKNKSPLRKGTKEYNDAPLEFKDYKSWAKQNKIYDFLLNTLDNAGNPFVVSTPWTDLYYHEF